LLVQGAPRTTEAWVVALRTAGHDLEVSATLADALQLAADGGIDVVVVDTPTPRTGVVELVRSLQRLPDAPPVVLISESPDAPEISARIGAASFLAKPVEPAELVSICNRLCGRTRPVLLIDDDEEEPTGPALVRPTTVS
jgi:DNA-binding response OmpR family regulator